MTGRLLIMTAVGVGLAVAFVGLIAWGSAAPTQVGAGVSAIVALLGGFHLGYTVGRWRGKP